MAPTRKNISLQHERFGVVSVPVKYLSRYLRYLDRRSHEIVRVLSRSFPLITAAWLALFGLGVGRSLSELVVPVHNWGDIWPIVLPYALIALAPIAGFAIAAGSFPSGFHISRPSFHLSFYGRWRSASVLEAHESPAFGPAGFMASLIVGLMLNVVMRSFEFLLAVPPMNGHAPDWGQSMFLVMAADVIVMSFFYMVCFVMALRSVPLFPRMLLFVWGVDILAQLMIAERLFAIPDLPAAIAAPLGTLLEGNITKVLISAFVWLPYLILSERVNITYRRRVRLPEDDGAA